MWHPCRLFGISRGDAVELSQSLLRRNRIKGGLSFWGRVNRYQWIPSWNTAGCVLFLWRDGIPERYTAIKARGVAALNYVFVFFPDVPF